jgi:2'-5' RNA ligase
MRNDEKIDINLATEGTSENLSEEELAQQNYETALRYINIAEHMNKFEDQDKYYHRAIQYLKKAKPYKKVQPLLRELRNKKFGTRAAGKIELYKEANKGNTGYGA